MLFQKITTGIQIVIGGYLILGIMIVVVTKLIPIAPLEISDYVVTKDSEIVIFSNFDSRFYIYSIDLKLKTSFKIPEYSGGPMLAIDENNNIYLAKRRSVLKYDMHGEGKLVASVSLDQPENWKLSKDVDVKHFNKISEDAGQVFTSKRLRRIAKPGDILFYEKSRADIVSIQEPFTDNKGNKYVCEKWFSGIKIFNSSGKFIAHLKPPILLSAFTLPFPGLYLWISGLTIIVLIQTLIRVRK